MCRWLFGIVLQIFAIAKLDTHSYCCLANIKVQIELESSEEAQVTQ